MTTLHTRVLAAVQQRMDVARAAGSTSRPSPRMVGRYAEWHAEPYYTSEDVPYSVVLQPPLGQIVPASMEARIADHIAANDPATVLRHCARDLAVLERHAPFADKEWVGPDALIERDPEVRSTDGWWTYTRCNGCEIWTNMGESRAEWPCSEITDLAAAYEVDGA